MDDDVGLAYMLLDGIFGSDSRGRPKDSLLKAGDALEIEARQAITRLLRTQEPLDWQIRNTLADMFDPNGGSQRHIKFEFRTRGNRRSFVRDHLIVSKI
jgi:hypothetical protein